MFNGAAYPKAKTLLNDMYLSLAKQLIRKSDFFFST